MTKEKRLSRDELLGLFQAVGRMLLKNDLEDSHSGNIATKWINERGEEQIVITATGSQKGDLDASQICFLSPTETDFGYYKASSETDIHVRILGLEGVTASIHAHTKDLTIATYDDVDKPNQPSPFVPIDPLGYYHLQGLIPVDWVEVPSGSSEMVKVIPGRLAKYPVTVVQGHGSFARGKSLKEALFNVCIANHAGYIFRLAEKLKVDVERIREEVKFSADEMFSYPPPKYTGGDDEVCDFPEEEEISREFIKTGARIFESKLSPFSTGSISVRGVKEMLFAPKGSLPREIGGPLITCPLSIKNTDSFELRIHKAIYAESHFQTILHCYVPEAEALSHFILSGKSKPEEWIIPIDAEGSFLYPLLPVVPAKIETSKLIQLLHDYRVVIVRGGGVWGAGSQSLSEALHHPSSVREICLYRIGAYERELNLKKLELRKGGLT